MKWSSFGWLVLSVSCLFVAGDVLARGGGGGGRGGGGGGGSRGGGGGGGYSRPSAPARSPSVSRPAPSPATRPSASKPAASRPSATPPKAATRPSTSKPGVAKPGTGAPGTGTRPGAGTGVATRPSQGQLQNFLDVKPGGAGAAAGAIAGGAVAGGAAADFLRGPQAGTLPAGGTRGPGVGAGAVGTRPGVANRPAANAVAGNRPSRIENRGERQGNRTERRNEIRDQVHDHPVRDFWSDHPVWGAWAITRPFRWASWGAMSGWVDYGSSEPAPYDYGENIYYEDDAVYYGDQQVATAEEYAQQAEAIATSVPETDPAKSEWMSLGVFALTPDGQASGPDPSLFLQLVISKEGVINGTLNNSATDSTQQIEGMVDKASQRCAWTVKGKTRPLMETGVRNLTEDSGPALVHFADGQTQQWLMVRLDDPTAAKK